MKVELKTNFEKVKAALTIAIEKIRAELKGDIEKVRADIVKTKGEVIKWVAGMLVAQAAIVATLVKLLS